MIHSGLRSGFKRRLFFHVSFFLAHLFWYALFVLLTNAAAVHFLFCNINAIHLSLSMGAEGGEQASAREGEIKGERVRT